MIFLIGLYFLDQNVRITYLTGYCFCYKKFMPILSFFQYLMSLMQLVVLLVPPTKKLKLNWSKFYVQTLEMSHKCKKIRSTLVLTVTLFLTRFQLEVLFLKNNFIIPFC